MIRKILIEGVRTHERTEIRLERLTCLVGPNGSGKSTVLQAIRLLGDDLPLPSWRRAQVATWRIEAEDFAGLQASVGHGLTRQASASGVLVLKSHVFRPDSEVLRSSSVYKGGYPQLDASGRELTSVLATWKLSDEKRFHAVLQQVKQIVPALQDLRPNPTKVDDKPGFELLFDFSSATGVPASAVSEGTLLVLALITGLHQIGNSAPVVLLDDIDRGLHPDAQVELIKLLRQLAELQGIQIVMTTHSPYIIDALAPEEVCVLALDATGTTRARQLSEIPGAEKYRGMLSTGELWSSHGESWVLEEQTKSALS